ncbi:MAG: alpha-L-glutamate ligase-like protein [Woeseiaceae bacterium]|nr:alpha-L-glutamate ligase-like protein [Woeseiaceae bacterium]
MMGFASPRRLRELGVVGMNSRNIGLIARHNPRRLYPLVDNKLKTKLLAEEHGIPTPGLIGSLHTQYDLRGIEEMIGERRGFAMKPAKGSGGKGILVITSRSEDQFVKASGVELDIDDVQRHASNILSGLFSLGGSPDVAVIEDLIRPDPIYKDLSVEGVPDIRVIVYRGFPVMSMMRLSTRASDGKANLHQGAVGVGLDIGSGTSVNAVQFNRPVYEHPDSGADLRDIDIPDWRGLLVLAAKCADASQLGYLGVDVVLDADRGPLLLELNARPGLAIQLANGAGLRPRIQAVNELPASAFRLDPEGRAYRSVELFGGSGSALQLF